MRQYYLGLIVMNLVFVALIAYNEYNIGTDRYVSRSHDYVKLYDLGWDDCDLVPAGNTRIIICR